jgi:hypothetical protein
MTTTSSTPTPFQSLEEQPRQFFAEFERQVYDDAGSSCLDIFPHGLLSFVVSTSIWNNFPDNNIIVDGVPTIRARNSLLPPLQPADNAVAGLWKAFEARSKAYDKFESALALLLRRIKLTLPSSDRNFLSHPVLGLVNFTTLELMDHLRMQYGTFRATDFANLTLQLQQKMPAGSDFNDVASKQRLIFAQFATNAQPLSELQQCQFLSAAISPYPHLVKARDLYYQHQPEPALQTFANLTAYVTLHSPNLLVTSADFGFSAQATATKPSSSTKSRNTDTPRNYCYVHGYDGHSSSQCRKMANDIATYSITARSAKDHTALSGGSTTRM